MEPLLIALISGTGAFNVLFALIWICLRPRFIGPELLKVKPDPEKAASSTSVPSSVSFEMHRMRKAPMHVSFDPTLPLVDHKRRDIRASVLSMDDTASMYSTMSAPLNGAIYANPLETIPDSPIPISVLDESPLILHPASSDSSDFDVQRVEGDAPRRRSASEYPPAPIASRTWKATLPHFPSMPSKVYTDVPH